MQYSQYEYCKCMVHLTFGSEYNQILQMLHGSFDI